MRAAALAILAVAGCAATAPAPEPGAPPALEGVLWRLAEFDGAAVNTDVTLAVADDRVRGAGPCNRYFGGFAQEGAVVAIGPVAATRRACPRLELEQRYFAALTEAASAEVAGHRLTLLDRNGAALMAFEG